MSEIKDVDEKEPSVHELSLNALDFTQLIEEKQRAHFAGTREWLFSAVHEWLKSPSKKRLFWVVGDAGTGKSVISAKLFQLDGIKEYVKAWHFCRHDNASMSAINVMLISWAAMLSKNLKGFEISEEVSSSGVASQSPEEMFAQLIGQPLARMKICSSEPCVIVLDALDELPKEALSPVLSLIANVFDTLPPFVRLFVTSRNQLDIVRRLEKFGNEKLLVDEVRNKADLRAYLAHVAREHVDLDITAAALEKMLEKDFGLPKGTLKDKLGELESLIAQSKYIYQEAMSEFKTLPEYHAICNFADIECNPPPKQTAASMDELYKDAELAHAKLLSAFAKGKQEGWVETLVDPGLKTLESATRKLNDEYKGNFLLLKDLARFTSEFEICTPMSMFLQKFRAESKDFRIVSMKNKHGNPTALGYRDFNLTLLVNLEGVRSHLCELQVNLTKMLAAKKQAHLHYEKIREHIPKICSDARITEENRFETTLFKILNNSVLDAAVAELELKAGGLFLYATLLAQQLHQDGGEEHVKIDFNKLYGLPTGLNEIYKENFDRLVGADDTRWREFVPAIALIVAAREPLSQRVAEEVLGPSLESVQSSLSVLFPVRNGYFQVMHKSVVDWLRDGKSAGMYHIGADDLKIAHNALGQYLLKCCMQGNLLEMEVMSNSVSSPLNLFAMRQVVYHLCQAGLYEEVYSVLRDLNWLLLRAKSAPMGLLADCELAAQSSGPHQLFCKLLYSALKPGLQMWTEDYQRMPGQLVGRLMGHEANNSEIGEFLQRVRSWSGPPQGWWCPVSQTFAPAGGPELSVFKLPIAPLRAEWSPDERCVAWLEESSDHVTLMDVTSGEIRSFLGHTERVNAFSWSNDSKKLCSGSNDKKVRVWDVESGECIKVLTGHSRELLALSWSNDNQKICSGSYDLTVRIWGVESGKELHKMQGHDINVVAVNWSSDGTKVCSGSWDNTVRVWDVENGECLQVLKGHTDNLRSVSWSHDSSRICSGSEDNTVRVWDVKSGECLQTMKGSNGGNSVCWSSDDKKICSASNDEKVYVWDVESGECVKMLKGHTHNVLSARWSADNKRICSASLDKTARVWDVVSADETINEHEGLTCYAVSWSHCNKKACSGSADNTVRVWDVENGKCIKTLQGRGSANSVCWDNDDKRICSGGSDQTVRVWDVESGECIKAFEGHTGDVFSVSWSRDNKRISSASKDQTVRVWDVESGECVKTLQGHSGYVYSVSWSSNNKLLCSGSSDKTVRVWDVESGECVKILKAHTDYVGMVRWCTDSKRLCSVSNDKTVRIWEIENDFSFCTSLLNACLQPVSGDPLEFVNDMDITVHPLLPSEALAIQNRATFHILHKLGGTSLSMDTIGQQSDADGRLQQEEEHTIERKQPQSSCSQCAATPDVECLHDTWCRMNLVQLPPGIEAEEQAAHQAKDQASSGDRQSILKNGASMMSGGMLTSPNGKYVLILQPDGNLVMYPSHKRETNDVLWETHTKGKGRGPHRLAMQADSHLVLYDNAGAATWATHVYNRGEKGAWAEIQDDGNFVVYDGAFDALWRTRRDVIRSHPVIEEEERVARRAFDGEKKTTLKSGAFLPSGGMLVSSNRRFCLIMQEDGNLVLYLTLKREALWASNTNGKGTGPYRLAMQEDNHLVICESSGNVIWTTKSSNRYPKGNAVLQDDGNFVVHNGHSQPLWCTRTDNRRSPCQGTGQQLMF